MKGDTVSTNVGFYFFQGVKKLISIFRGTAYGFYFFISKFLGYLKIRFQTVSMATYTGHVNFPEKTLGLDLIFCWFIGFRSCWCSGHIERFPKATPG
jgi:hypothetical protein